MARMEVWRCTMLGSVVTPTLLISLVVVKIGITSLEGNRQSLTNFKMHLSFVPEMSHAWQGKDRVVTVARSVIAKTRSTLTRTGRLATYATRVMRPSMRQTRKTATGGDVSHARCVEWKKNVDRGERRGRLISESPLSLPLMGCSLNSFILNKYGLFGECILSWNVPSLGRNGYKR